MSEFHAEKNGERLSVVSSDWSFLSDDPAPGLFSLKIKDAISIESLPAELGESPETVALPERRRLHRLSGGKEIALECTGTIPFGTSPEIRRKYRFFENEMIVVSDFLLRHSFPMKQISAGGLKFSGPFRRFGILSAPQSGSALLPPVQWTSLLPSDVSAPQTEEAGRPEPCCCRTKKTETSEKPQKSAQARESKKQNMTEEKTPKEKVEKTLLLYRSSAPPLSFLLECEGEKSVLRFRIGEDCWRWIHAARLNGESVFSIFRTGEGEILFTWNLLEWKGKTEDAERARCVLGMLCSFSETPLEMDFEKAGTQSDPWRREPKLPEVNPLGTMPLPRPECTGAYSTWSPSRGKPMPSAGMRKEKFRNAAAPAQVPLPF